MLSLHDWRPSLTLTSSLTLSVWISVAHLSVLALLPFWQAGELTRLLVAFCVMGSWGMMHRSYALLRAKRSVKKVTWCSDGWILETNNQLEGPLVLASSSRVSQNFILLHFKRSSDRFRIRFCVPILKDSIGDESFRLLQVFLRWQRVSILNPTFASQDDT